VWGYKCNTNIIVDDDKDGKTGGNEDALTNRPTRLIMTTEAARGGLILGYMMILKKTSQPWS
jgi:hypothetical protein